MNSNNKISNRLIKEKSPYLLQHANNPVNWYPWKEEAFERAKKEDKPIFLSIGYSTCHWCHVMEEESFEDEQVASLLNKDFISIKVDREERPDIDTVYMKVCQAFTGQGGWPLTVFMTPEQTPFYAATYIPKKSKYGMLGLINLLPAIAEKWKNNRKQLLAVSKEVDSILYKQYVSTNQSKEPTKTILEQAIEQFKNNFDKENGGFGTAPKFPVPSNLFFLLNYAVREERKDVLELAEKTLEGMYKGGIFDHIGGGFSRYSTDNRWLIPHFEKMLYDNALLIIAYIEAYEITKKELYLEVAERTINYIRKELLNKEGGFYCGQDADSEGIEGKYYIFIPKEIKEVLGEKEGEIFNDLYDITQEGNFEGYNIPNLLSQENFFHLSKKYPNIEQDRQKLYEYRKKRTKLHKDDKILTSWNALMIVALAKAYQVLREKEYLDMARNIWKFIENNLIDKKQRLKIRYREKEAIGYGVIDDYAFTSWALLELYHSSFNIYYLEKAIHLAEEMINQFWDFKQGGFFFYAKDAERLIDRPKEIYDGALPSGNSVASIVLSQIFRLTANIKWKEFSYKQNCFLTGNIENYLMGNSFALYSIMQEMYPSIELICVVSEQKYKEMKAKKEIDLKLEILKGKVLNNTMILIKTSENKDKLEQIVPFSSMYPFPDTGVTYYMCKNGVCNKPVNKIDDIIESYKMGKIY